MRPDTTTDILDAISDKVITTFLAARLDFLTETISVWTGPNAIEPTGSGDSLLDGQHFDPLVYGVVVDVGDNTYHYTGSDELVITLNVPAAPNVALAAAETFPNEFQGRQATIWRAILIRPDDPLAEPIWQFRRIRSGAMDKLEVSNDGQSHTFKLTIESHASLISNATNSTYMDQTKFDPTDTSQAYAASIANGGMAPSNISTASQNSGGGGGGAGQRCVTTDTPILLADRTTREAGGLRVGDMLWTQHEHTLEWGAYPIEAIEFADEPVYLASPLGRPIRATADHRFYICGEWVEMHKIGGPCGRGMVAKITVTDAHTYVSAGILSHNIKMQSSGYGETV